MGHQHVFDRKAAIIPFYVAKRQDQILDHRFRIYVDTMINDAPPLAAAVPLDSSGNDSGDIQIFAPSFRGVSLPSKNPQISATS